MFLPDPKSQNTGFVFHQESGPEMSVTSSDGGNTFAPYAGCILYGILYFFVASKRPNRFQTDYSVGGFDRQLQLQYEDYDCGYEIFLWNWISIE